MFVACIFDLGFCCVVLFAACLRCLICLLLVCVCRWMFGLWVAVWLFCLLFGLINLVWGWFVYLGIAWCLLLIYV